MTKNNLKNYILTAILTVIFAIGTSIPFGMISVISSVALVGLVGYTVTRFHYIFVGFVCICILIPYVSFVGELSSAIYAYSEVIIYGVSLGICFNLKLSGIKTAGIVSGLNIAYTLLAMIVMGVSNDFVASLTDGMQSFYPLYEEYITQEDYRSLMLTAIEMMTKFIPSFIVLSSVFIGIIYFVAFRFILKITKSKSHYEMFSDYRADKPLSIIYFALSVISFFVPADSYYGDILRNIVLISTFIFFVFGLALIAYKLKNRFGNSPKAKFLLALAIFSPLFALGLPFTVIGYIGALDGIFDFRLKNSSKNTINKD